MNHAKTIVQNLLSLSIGEIITRLGGFLLSLFVARTLGVGAFGQLSFALALTSYFTLFSDFGLTTLGTKEISQNRDTSRWWGTNILVLQVAVSIALVLILAIFLFFASLDIHTKWLTFLFGLTIIPSALNMSYILQAHEQMDLVAAVKVITQIVYVILGYGTLWWMRDTLSLPIVSLVAGIAGSWVAYVLLKKYIHFYWERIDLAFIRTLIFQAWPFVLTAFMIQLYLNVDSVMLQFYRGEVAVGYYNAAYKIVLLIFSILSLVNGVLFPVLSRQVNQGDEFRNTLLTATQYLGIIAVPASIGGIYLAPKLIPFIYGDSYGLSVIPFQLLIIYPLMKFLGATFEISLVVSNRIKLVTVATTIAAAINVLLNLWLIPLYGMIGAAIATLVAEVVSLGFQGFFFHRYFRFSNVASYLVKPVIGSLIMVVILYYFYARLPFIPLFIVGAVSYLGVMLAIRGVYIMELKQLLKFGG